MSEGTVGLVLLAMAAFHAINDKRAGSKGTFMELQVQEANREHRLSRQSVAIFRDSRV